MWAWCFGAFCGFGNFEAIEKYEGEGRGSN